VQLDRLAVQLRLRNPWEAIDLGFAMVRAWARPVYAAWLAVYVPLCTAALLILPAAWALLAVWWLKPAVDRVVLHVLAAGVFGDLPRLRDALRALPRAFGPGLIPSLTYYRFFPARSFNLPVWQLERQTGATARKRRRQLHRRTSNYAVWLTIACMHFELVLALSGIALYDLFTPAPPADSFELFQLLSWKDQAARQIVLTVLVFAASSIMEPFYVAGGFALYLNRRTALEGWDLEVALRRMGERARAGDRAVQPAIAAACALVLATLLAIQAPAVCLAQDAPAGESAEAESIATAAERPADEAGTAAEPAAAAEAQEGPAAATPTPVAQRRAAREIREILERPEFDVYRDRTTLQYFGPPEERKKRPRGASLGFATFIDALSQVLRILAVAAVGLALVFLVYYLMRRFELLERERSAYVPPQTLFGLDVRPESLPDDVAGAALQLARSGELAKALSLLYRATLATLLHRDGVELASGDTESDCLRKSRSRIPEPSHTCFARLLSAWQRLAYARREVALEEVQGLCEDWRTHFSEAKSQADASG
jgi:hypothetical protein